MARPQDPTRLTKDEAKRFRDLVAQMRELKDCTLREIADAAGVSYDRVTNALKAGRPLLAENAYTLWRGLCAVKADTSLGWEDAHRAAESLLKTFQQESWVTRYIARMEAIPALFPAASIQELAEIIAAEVVSVHGVSERLRADIAGAVARALRRHGLRMAQAWMLETQGGLMPRFVSKIDPRSPEIFDDQTRALRETIVAAAQLAQPKVLDSPPNPFPRTGKKGIRK